MKYSSKKMRRKLKVTDYKRVEVENHYAYFEAYVGENHYACLEPQTFGRYAIACYIKTGEDYNLISEKVIVGKPTDAPLPPQESLEMVNNWIDAFNYFNLVLQQMHKYDGTNIVKAQR